MAIVRLRGGEQMMFKTDKPVSNTSQIIKMMERMDKMEAKVQKMKGIIQVLIKETKKLQVTK
jgi:hypothetical protein